MTVDSIANAAPRRPRLLQIALVVFAAASIILSLFGIAASRIPMRGAEFFGFVANKIKGNPGSTTVVCLSAVTGLWLAIGLVAAVQEWLARRRGVPRRS